MLAAREARAAHVQPTGRLGHVPTAHVEVAGQTHQGEHRPLVLQAVGLVDHRHAAEDQGRRSAGSVEAGGLTDLVGRHSRDLGGPLRRILGGQVTELIEAPRPLGHELPIVEPLRDENVGHGQRQRPIGARAQRQMQVGHTAEAGGPGVDHDQLGSPFAGVQ